jgi:hypothetical protein
MSTSKLGSSDSYLGNIELGLINQVYTLSVSDTLSLSSSLSLNGIYGRSFSQSLSFSPSLSLLTSKPVSQSLSFTQSISADLFLTSTHNTKYECIHDTLEFSQSQSSLKTYRIIDILQFIQGCITYELDHTARSYIRSISQSLSFTDSEHACKHSVIPLSISQSLSFSQTQSATNNAIDKSISQSLSFTPTLSSHVTVAIPLSISQSLSFSQSLINRMTRPRLISHSLSLTQSYPYHRTTFGVLRQSFSLSSSSFRNIVSRHSLSDFLNLSLPPVLYLSYANPIVLPNPDVIVVHPKPFFIYLQSDSNHIYLPAPLFDDSESGLNSVSIKRSMVGGSRSYVHSSRNVKFRYSFSLSRQQSYNLQEFLVRTNAKSIFLLNWKYEKYVGYITSNPLVIVEKRVWDNVTDLEFQGVRI